MKIGIITPYLKEHKHRGIGIYSDNLIQSLKSFPKIDIITGNYKNLPKNVDLYHFTYFDPFFLTIPMFIDKPVVVTIHDLIPLRFPKHFPIGIKGTIKFLIQKFKIKKANAIITDSYASKSDIIKYLNIPDEKIYPIYLAPLDKYYERISYSDKEKIKNKYKLPEKFMLFVGDTNWNKNLPKVIIAAKEVNIPLVIVSKSLKEYNINKYNAWTESLIISKKLINNDKLITVLGNIDLTELVGIYQMAEVLLYPSFYEGFGFPVVEAFASECPVITSNKGSLQEIASFGALFVDPDNQMEINQAIIKIHKDKEMKKELIEKGKKISQSFSWNKTAWETIDVYNLVLNSKY